MPLQQLASIADLTVFGMAPANALQGFTDPQKNQALGAASDMFFGYASEQFTGPLTAYGDDIKRCVVSVAIYLLMCSRGVNAATGIADALIVKNYNDAIQWMKDVGRGLVRPPGLVDSTPDVVEDGADGDDGSAADSRYLGICADTIL